MQGRDLIADDVLYHKTCYRDKTRQKSLSKVDEKGEMENIEDVAHEQPASGNAFVALFEEIERVVISDMARLFA